MMLIGFDFRCLFTLSHSFAFSFFYSLLSFCFRHLKDGGNDFFIDNVRERNRALNSDEVAAEIKPKQQWKIIPECQTLVRTNKSLVIEEHQIYFRLD
jgi:hypothetical protein